MIKGILIGVLIFTSTYLFGQRPLVEADFGMAVPTHSDLKTVFDAGLNFNAGLAFPVVDEKLYLKPTVGVQWYFKKVGNESVTENFRTWKGGLEIRYYVLDKDGWQLAPCLNIDYNGATNFYSSSYTDPITNQTTGSSSSDYLKGSGLSYAIGSVVNRGRVYFKLKYELYAPTLKLSQKIVAAAYEEGILIDATPKLNLSSLNLTIGYTFEIQ